MSTPTQRELEEARADHIREQRLTEDALPEYYPKTSTEPAPAPRTDAADYLGLFDCRDTAKEYSQILERELATALRERDEVRELYAYVQNTVKAHDCECVTDAMVQLTKLRTERDAIRQQLAEAKEQARDNHNYATKFAAERDECIRKLAERGIIYDHAKLEADRDKWKRTAEIQDSEHAATIARRDALAARLADAEKVIAHFLHVWEETECEHDDVMPVVDASRAFLATKPKS